MEGCASSSIRGPHRGEARAAEVECREKFVPRLRLPAEYPEHAAGHETCGRLLYAARGHAAVRRLTDGGTPWGLRRRLACSRFAAKNSRPCVSSKHEQPGRGAGPRTSRNAVRSASRYSGSPQGCRRRRRRSPTWIRLQRCQARRSGPATWRGSFARRTAAARCRDRRPHRSSA